MAIALINNSELLEVLEQHIQYQIIPFRNAISLIAIGKFSLFTAYPVATPYIPVNQFFPLVYHRHFHLPALPEMCSQLLYILQQGFTQTLILSIGRYGKHAQISPTLRQSFYMHRGQQPVCRFHQNNFIIGCANNAAHLLDKGAPTIKQVCLGSPALSAGFATVGGFHQLEYLWHISQDRDSELWFYIWPVYNFFLDAFNAQLDLLRRIKSKNSVY
jgi:hypothetical protein